MHHAYFVSVSPCERNSSPKLFHSLKGKQLLAHYTIPHMAQFGRYARASRGLVSISETVNRKKVIFPHYLQVVIIIPS